MTNVPEKLEIRRIKGQQGEIPVIAGQEIETEVVETIDASDPRYAEYRRIYEESLKRHQGE